MTGFAPDPLFQIGTDITIWAENNPGRLWFTRAASLIQNNNQDLQFPYRDRSGYCGQVIDLMPATLASLGSPYTFNQLVHGVSTHQYIVGKPITDGDKLEMVIEQWTGRLSDFVEWVNGYEDLMGLICFWMGTIFTPTLGFLVLLLVALHGYTSPQNHHLQR